jgi:acyl-CoA thioester hydrolase
MARIKLELPEKFIFSTEIPIRVTDLNYGGHVGSDKMLSIVQEARVQLLRKIGYKNELMVEDLGIIVADTAILYKAEIFYGNKIKVDAGVKDFTETGFDFVFRLMDAHVDIEYARVKTGVLFFNYISRKVSKIPGAFMVKLNILN